MSQKWPDSHIWWIFYLWVAELTAVAVFAALRSIWSFSCSKIGMVNSLLLKGVDSDPIHDCASSLSLPSGLGCSLSWACSASWTIKTGFCFSALSAGLLNLTSLVELSTTGHEPYHGHNYTWHIRGLNLSQVPEGGCSFAGSELQDCLGAPTEPEESDVPAPKRCGVVENVCHQAKEPWKGVSRLHSIRNNKKSKTLQVEELVTSKYIEGGAGTVCAYQVGKWMCSQWWRLGADGFWHQEKDSCSSGSYAIAK